MKWRCNAMVKRKDKKNNDKVQRAILGTIEIVQEYTYMHICVYVYVYMYIYMSTLL